jgi:hypothetical protein
MAHDDADRVRRDLAEQPGKVPHVVRPQASVLDCEGPRGVCTDHGNLSVAEVGVWLAADVTAEAAKRIPEACQHVVERHVVITGDDDLGSWQRVEEGAGAAELGAARALRQVT